MDISGIRFLRHRKIASVALLGIGMARISLAPASLSRQMLLSRARKKQNPLSVAPKSCRRPHFLFISPIEITTISLIQNSPHARDQQSTRPPHHRRHTLYSSAQWRRRRHLTTTPSASHPLLKCSVAATATPVRRLCWTDMLLAYFHDTKAVPVPPSTAVLDCCS